MIGIGNAWQGDDAAGLHAARLLAPQLADDVRVRQLEGEPVGLVEALDGADEVFLIDAVRSGAPPGTIHRLDAAAAPIPTALAAASTHTLGVGEAIELARALGRLPRRVIVYGIEAASLAAGEELTPPVATAVAEVVERVVAECTSSR